MIFNKKRNFMEPNRFVDLHIHSCYSDGTLTPQEILSAAQRSGVGVLAISDHDTIDGSLVLRDLCRDSGIAFIPAVEINGLEGSTNFHVLAYGFQFDHPEFRRFLQHVHAAQDRFNQMLLEVLQQEYASISLEEYREYTYDRSLGGWKTLHYLIGKGIASSLQEGAALYSKYNITFDRSGYPSIRSICEQIHAAGGYAVLAHPGRLIDASDISAFSAELERLIAFGLDGVECYYPTHSPSVTQACLDVCRSRDLLITTGSDCHGDFGRTKVGQLQIPLQKVKLNDLINR
jgi:predicted metal-dependent phosphoesterase TrpH